jgi:predicted glycosyltransferase involved in capsule biosynthesis
MFIFTQAKIMKLIIPCEFFSKTFKRLHFIIPMTTNDILINEQSFSYPIAEVLSSLTNILQSTS